ncbi:MAG: tetratricopeptide repeat protein [Pseudomonadota bacterium]
MANTDKKQSNEQTEPMEKARFFFDDKAQNDLGIAYDFIQGFVHQKKTFKRLLKAAKQELITAQCHLALAYKKGQRVKKDDKKSLYWLQKAAVNTVLKVKIEPDLNQVKEDDLISFLSEEAKEGIVPAQVVLAHFYQMGTEQDRQQIFSWMEKAAQQQDLIAQYHLGVMYMEGQGVAANMEKASEQFQQIVGGIKNILTHFTEYKRSHSFSRVFGDILSEQFQQIVGRVKNILTHSTEYKRSHSFSRVFGDILRKNDKDKTDYSRDIKQWIGLLAQEKLGAIKVLEQEKAAKQELEDVMAMFAHKFRGPLQSIQYNAEHSNQKQITLQAVQTMAGLLNIFSTIATDAQQLRLKLQQDMQGEGTILSVLEKALLPVIKQVLTINNAKKIRQHYLGYAKKTGQVPATTTRKQWVEDYFQIEEQLQAAWEESFSAAPRLERLVAWIEERFFPLEVTGFNNDAIHFERYGATESTLIIVLTEILLNAVKYYSSKTGEPVRLDWQTDQKFATIVCENPSSRDERRIDKGSQKGHKFLNLIVKKLQGDFPEPLRKNPYQLKWQIPMDLLMRNEQ